MAIQRDDREGRGLDLRTLLDIEEIKKLRARYFRLLDEQRFDDWAALFTPDVHTETPQGGAREGREALLVWVRSRLEGDVTVHHGHMPEIELTGPTTARGIWAMSDHVEHVSDGTRVVFAGYGYYFDEYRKDDGVWRISSMRFVRLRVDSVQTTTNRAQDIPGLSREGGS